MGVCAQGHRRWGSGESGRCPVVLLRPERGRCPVVLLRPERGRCRVVLLRPERGRCRVVLLRPERVICRIFLLITISHCAWRHFISFSNGEKETDRKKRLQTPASS